MSVKFCDNCDKFIDLDEDVEHFEMHQEVRCGLCGKTKIGRGVICSCEVKPSTHMQGIYKD